MSDAGKLQGDVLEQAKRQMEAWTTNVTSTSLRASVRSAQEVDLETRTQHRAVHPSPSNARQRNPSNLLKPWLLHERLQSQGKTQRPTN